MTDPIYAEFNETVIKSLVHVCDTYNLINQGTFTHIPNELVY